MNLVGVAGLSLAAVAGGLYASDALTRGEVYPLSYDQAFAELSSMPLPAEVTQMSVRSVGSQVEVRTEGSVIAWHFMADGRETGRFTATLSPEGEGKTRVIVDFVSGSHKPEGMLRISDTALMRKLAAAALAEQVDSQLERRPFEQSGFMQRAAEHLQNNPEQLKEYGEAVGQTMNDLYSQARENAEASSVPAYEPPVGKPSPDATRPSLDLSNN